MQLTGAQALIKSLEQAGVDVMFGYPGGAILPTYDALLESSIRHVLVRHEQGGGHMAEGYALATGKPGVLMITSGPGATNAITPIADAYLDSVPLVVITGQVSTSVMGTDAFQEAPIIGITAGIVKHSYLVQSAAEIPRVVAAAFYIATTGRPGPVLIDFPKNVSLETMEWYWPTTVEELDLPGYQPEVALDMDAVNAAAELINNAQRPILYVGGGTIKSDASKELWAFAERTGMPVVTTLQARGAFPDSHKQHLGMPGMHGTYTAVTAIQKSDLLISLGARFDDRVTGKVSTFAPNAKIIHVDIDPVEFNKIKKVNVAIQSNVAAAISALDKAGAKPKDLEVWWKQLNAWREEFPLFYEEQKEGSPLRPQMVIEAINASSKPGTIVSTDVGQHQMYASQFWKFEEPRTWLSSGGAGTMGFGLPAAIGAKVGAPDKTVWAIVGDGGVVMTIQELLAASAAGINVKVCILNNEFLGMVYQWQQLVYDGRLSHVALPSPDFVKIAEGMHCVGIKATTVEEMHAAIKQANEINDKPVVIDFRTDPSENVWPMVHAGASNDEIIVHPTQRGN